MPVTLSGSKYAWKFNCADACVSKLTPVTTTVPKVRSILDYMGYGAGLYHRLLGIPVNHLDSLLTPALFGIAIVLTSKPIGNQLST